MRQPTDPEVFRFLDLPLEIQNKIYGNLLIYHEPVVLKFRHPVEPERRGVRWGSYETRLGMFPQICRLSWKFAWDSLAVLYGENTFHFTLSSDIFRLKYSLGLNTCSHFIKRVVMDIFTSEISDSLGTCTDLRRQSNFWKNERLDMQSKVWVRIHVPVGVFPNVKKLYLNLPKNLEVLTKNNEDLVLEMKRDVPKHAVVEFTGAMPDIVSKLTAAWFNHDAEKLDELPKCVHLTPNILSS